MTVPPCVAAVLEALEAAGWESYAVGGCVRDSLLGIKPHDWDVTTAARPEQVEAVFAGERIIETGLQHGTVTLLTGDGPVEITTFRTEGSYSDGRHPDSVAFVSDLREDLRRRDFTVNAMAYSPRRGLRDEFGGREDLRRGVIRCVGRPDDRFREDALRILRCLRFAARFDFQIEPDTARAMLEHRALLDRISPERIFSELKGILTAPGAGRMMLLYPEVFLAAVPEMAPSVGFDQRRPDAHQHDVWGHTAHAVDAIEPDTILRLTMFFHDCAKPAAFVWDEEKQKGQFWGHSRMSAEMADGILRRLRCDNGTRETVCLLVDNHGMLDGHGKRAMARLAARLGEENVRRLFAVCRADAKAHTPAVCRKRLAMLDGDEAAFEELLSEGRCLKIGDLAVGGGELLSLGYVPGPAVGKALKTLLGEVVDGELENDPAALLRRAEELREGTENV